MEGFNEDCVLRASCVVLPSPGPCRHALLLLDWTGLQCPTSALLLTPRSSPPLQDYMDPTHPRTSFLVNVRHMFDLRDVMDDMSLVRGRGGPAYPRA